MRQPTVLWALFGFDGRLNRQAFWLAILFSALFGAALVQPGIDPETNLIHLGPLSPFLGVFWLWTQVSLSAKRLHDRNISGWFAIVSMIPLLNVLAIIAIGLLPGDKGPNRFAPATNMRG